MDISGNIDKKLLQKISVVKNRSKLVKMLRKIPRNDKIRNNIYI